MTTATITVRAQIEAAVAAATFPVTATFTDGAVTLTFAEDTTDQQLCDLLNGMPDPQGLCGWYTEETTATGLFEEVRA